MELSTPGGAALFALRAISPSPVLRVARLNSATQQWDVLYRLPIDLNRFSIDNVVLVSAQSSFYVARLHGYASAGAVLQCDYTADGSLTVHDVTPVDRATLMLILADSRTSRHPAALRPPCRVLR